MLVVYGSIQSGSTSLWARIADRNKMQHLERKTALCEGDLEKVALSELIYKKRIYLSQNSLNVNVTFGHI